MGGGGEMSFLCVEVVWFSIACIIIIWLEHVCEQPHVSPIPIHTLHQGGQFIARISSETLLCFQIIPLGVLLVRIVPAAGQFDNNLYNPIEYQYLSVKFFYFFIVKLLNLFFVLVKCEHYIARRKKTILPHDPDPNKIKLKSDSNIGVSSNVENFS